MVGGQAGRTARRPARVRSAAGLLLVAMAAAACSGGTMRILNRTQSPVLVTVDGAEIAVEACAERTIRWGGSGWGRGSDGLPVKDAAAPGAVVVAFGTGLFWRIESAPSDVLVAVTPDYAGAEMLDDTNYQQLAGGRGRFPADPGSIPCAGTAATPLP